MKRIHATNNVKQHIFQQQNVLFGRDTSTRCKQLREHIQCKLQYPHHSSNNVNRAYFSSKRRLAMYCCKTRPMHRCLGSCGSTRHRALCCFRGGAQPCPSRRLTACGGHVPEAVWCSLHAGWSGADKDRHGGDCEHKGGEVPTAALRAGGGGSRSGLHHVPLWEPARAGPLCFLAT